MTTALASAAQCPRCRRAKSVDAERDDADGDDGDADHTIGGGVSTKTRRDAGDDQRRQAAHDRIGDRQFAVAIGARDQGEVGDVDEARRQNIGNGAPTTSAQGTAASTSPTTAPPAAIAVAAAPRSGSRRTRAFQTAWRRAATSSAAKTGMLNAILTEISAENRGVDAARS